VIPPLVWKVRPAKISLYAVAVEKDYALHGFDIYL
jgi:hypothetical protein